MATTTPSINLPASELPPCSGSISLAPVPVSTCQLKNETKKFKEIAYLTKSNAFYLLTETAVDYLNEAESLLKSRLSGDYASMMQGLSKAKILDGLLSADVVSFMPEDVKKKYLESKQWLKEHAGSEYTFHFSFGELALDPEHDKHQRQVDACIKVGIEQAKEQGYTYDKGQLYSEREIKTKKCVEKYIAAREVFAKDRTHAPEEQIKKLEQQLAQLRELFGTKLADGSYQILYIAEYQHTHLVDSLDKSNKAYNELCQCIEDLAKVGIATPELALAGGKPTADGHSLLAEYHQYLQQAQEYKEALNQRIKEVVEATNGYAIPPSAAFEREYAALERIEKKSLALYQSAVNTILTMKNPLRLMWDLNYRPKPIQKLVKGDFPLREMLLAAPKGGKGEFGELRYFSLNDVPRSNDKATIHYSTTTDSDLAFSQLLGKEVFKVSISQQWFDEKGLFLPKEFYAYLEKNALEVETLQSKPAKWEAALGNILYSNVLKKRIDPFDSSWQSQFFRMSQKFSTAEPKAALGYENSTKSGESSQSLSANTTLAEVEAKLDMVSARGEVNLIELATGSPYLYFPRAVNPNEVMKLTYQEGDGTEKVVNFVCGAIQSRVYCKAWGFAGASLALGGKVELGEQGLSFPTLYEQEPDSPSATLKLINLKAEANLGIELGSYIDWYVPDSIPDFVRPNDANKLMLVKGSVKAQVGTELKIPIRFFMKNDKLNIGLTIGTGTKVELEGEIQPEALGAWIWQFQQILRKCHYHKIAIANTEDFKQLSAMSKAMMAAQLNIGLFLAEGKDKFDRMMDILGSSKSAVVAYSIVFGKQNVLETWVKGMAPEALGPLLWTLTQEPDDAQISDIDELELSVRHSYAVQKIALALILDWIDKYPSNMGLKASQRQFEEALVRMNSTGVSGKEQFEKDYDFKRNLNTIRRFNSGDINLLTQRDGGNAVDIKISNKFDRIFEKVNDIGLNVTLLVGNKEREIDSNWNDIIKLKVDKSDANRFY